MGRPPTDPRRLIEIDPWLAPFAEALSWRSRAVDAMRERLGLGDSLDHEVTLAHRRFGLHVGEQDSRFEEWAPGADYLSLIGDFNGWDPAAHPLRRDEWGFWRLDLPFAIPHESLYKVHVGRQGVGADRIPPYARRVVQDPVTHGFSAQVWQPPVPYVWQHATPASSGAPRIYEAHVGMAREDGTVGTFRQFTEDVLPRIGALGYDVVQLMAVMEHPYYGSFGYHVANFYAVSSRFGTPEDLKALVDTAHGLGIRVVMDLVHSHSVKNLLEGLNRFDGTDHQYFHAGARGEHAAWDSLCFDYGKFEVLRFLLSNVRFWLEEYRFDGFRFDGVTSMLYLDHGLGRTFGDYADYFGPNVDLDAVAYLSLANEVAHQVRPRVVTIAEDVSGMPGLARPVAEGGLGFDYRLAMGVPDLWIRLLKEQRDEEWNLGEIYAAMVNRRAHEAHIAYAESHDQALVGDKTLAFWLMDARMYNGMSKFIQDPVIDRGVALHKMIRLLTMSLAGEGYLNFMGNEFGHPEWIDFPRAENGFSHHYARRQWSLAEQDHLHYHSLLEFDRAMLSMERAFGLLGEGTIEQLALHEDTRQLVYRRGPLVFAFNFHATESYADLRIPVPTASDYELVLSTDDVSFGGPGRVAQGFRYPWQSVPMYGRGQSVQIYLPSRTALVLAPLSRH